MTRAPDWWKAPALLTSLVTQVVAWAGGPTPDVRQQWIQNTVQFTKEQDISRVDLGRQLLLSLVDEIGVWKVLAVLFLFVLGSVGGTVWGVVKLLKGRGT